MNDLVKVFNSWEPLLKSLAHQEKVTAVAMLLKDKRAEDITFTAVNVDGTTEKFVLGSFEGNLKFLMGYVNCGFCVAPYHFQVIDPNLSEEEAAAIFEVKGHPGIPRFWEDYGLSPFLEGDTENGSPHPEVFTEPAIDETFTVKVESQSWNCDPERQLVTANATGHSFSWSLVKNTYLASQSPEMVEKMTPFEPTSLVIHKSLYSDEIRNRVFSSVGRTWDSDVFPLVKSIYPRPGTVLRLQEAHGESVYAVVTPDSIELFSKGGEPAFIEAYDRKISRIDLLKGGDCFPSVLLGFAVKYLDFDISTVEQYIE